MHIGGRFGKGLGVFTIMASGRFQPHVDFKQIRLKPVIIRVRRENEVYIYASIQKPQ